MICKPHTKNRPSLSIQPVFMQVRALRHALYLRRSILKLTFTNVNIRRMSSDLLGEWRKGGAAGGGVWGSVEVVQPAFRVSFCAGEFVAISKRYVK